jgi:hypothetical protein
MDNDLTIDTLSFNLAWSDKAGSMRREVSRGANLPTEMRVSHSESVDSASKMLHRRSLVRFDRHIELSTGKIVPVSAYMVVSVPKDPDVADSDITTVAGHFQDLLSSGGLDLDAELFVSALQ